MPPKFVPVSLTLKGQSGGFLNVLVSDIKINAPNSSKIVSVKGIWDTGASATVITKKVVSDLGLEPTGKVYVSNAGDGGTSLRNTYIVNVLVHDQLNVQGVTVTDADALSGADALIGMDIIMLGDFSITNFKGNTVMSFRFPSMQEIDYGIEIARNNTIIKHHLEHHKENQKCVCGSGLPFKKCHGKDLDFSLLPQ